VCFRGYVVKFSAIVFTLAFRRDPGLLAWRLSYDFNQKNVHLASEAHNETHAINTHNVYVFRVISCVSLAALLSQCQ
jgi:hypothetical protein